MLSKFDRKVFLLKSVQQYLHLLLRERPVLGERVFP